MVRIALACLPLVAVAVTARADTTAGAPPSRADATLRRFDGPFAPALGGEALRRRRCAPAFIEAFPGLATPKEVAAELHCRRLPSTVDVAGTPFLEAQRWEGHARFGWDKQVEVLAVRTPRGWWVAPVASFWENRLNAGDDSGITVEGVAPAATGDAGVLVIRWRDATDNWTCDAHPLPADDADNPRTCTVTTHALAVVGVGASGVPAVTAPVDLAVEMRADGDGETMRAERDASFSGGVLVVGPARVAPTSLPRAAWEELVAPLRPARLPLPFR